MNKKFFKVAALILLVSCFVFTIGSAEAFAWGGHDSRRDRYHYRDGKWFGRGWFGIEIAIPILPRGTVVTFLPAGCMTFTVKGTRYYYHNNIYYRSCPGGYVVVPAPEMTPGVAYVPVVTQPYTEPVKTVVINVPNSNGSFTPVTLIKQKNGYIGPQGEYYSDNPTVEQLRVLYGR